MEERVLASERPVWASYWLELLFGALLLPLFGAGLLVIGYVWLDRMNRLYRVTDLRVSARGGILSRSVDEVLVAHVRSMNVKQNLIGRLLHFGDLLVGTAGTDGVEIVMKGVREPSAWKELIAKGCLEQGGTSRD
ncbi:MAG: hypothetical protein MOGMAGMI_01504 [Candidatus Omnitrophica bacterium]|nr:hypothetical protein [Candidatus Omnitrophota bacterium]